jgi:hypothetical protein
VWETRLQLGGRAARDEKASHALDLPHVRHLVGVYIFTVISLRTPKRRVLYIYLRTHKKNLEDESGLQKALASKALACLRVCVCARA